MKTKSIETLVGQFENEIESKIEVINKFIPKRDNDSMDSILLEMNDNVMRYYFDKILPLYLDQFDEFTKGCLNIEKIEEELREQIMDCSVICAC